MTFLDWVAVAVILGGLLFLRRRIAALVGRTAAWVRARPPLGLVLAIALSVLAVVFLAWKLPQWQLASRRMYLTAKEYLELQNSYRATIVQAFGGLILLVGIYFTLRRVAATERQVEVAREGQITERFTRAIEQLGKKDQLEVRLGGIYALERIARDSERDHWPIMEVLTAYVRENAPRRIKPKEEEKPGPLATDIQAILTVIGRRRVEFERAEEQRLDLSGTNLSGADLRGANLSGVSLFRADLSGATLWRADLSAALLLLADLSGAYLYEAHLSGALLMSADLSGANLTEANLSRARLPEADLTGADLSGADLSGADLSGADLSEAEGLTREQIESAITDKKTILPDYLKEGGEGEPEAPAKAGEAED